MHHTMAADAIDCRHRFAPASHGRERRAQIVVALTAGMMVVELVVGYLTRSMALTADGWHMATHAGALGISAAAYWFARTRALDRRFAFGTGKINALAGYTSALVLVVVALTMLGQSGWRLVHPVDIHFREALPVAIVGLVVNLASAKILDLDEHHAGGAGAPTDHNHAAAYMHVLADTVTSVLAVAALLVGMRFGWRRFDSLSGLAGGLLVLKWGYGLCRDSARQLVDATASPSVEQDIRARLEAVDDVHVTDLHSWDVGHGRRSCVVALMTSTPRPPAYYRDVVLAGVDVAHLTVQVERCAEGHDPPGVRPR